MFYLIQNDQIVGTVDNPDESPNGFIVIEGIDANFLTVYYDASTKTVKLKPTQPPHTYWDSTTNTYISIADSNANLDLDALKLFKINELNSNCQSAIYSGFESASLGDVYLYDSEEKDQTNLIGAVLLNSDINYTCTNIKTSVKAPVLHTANQIRNVLTDGTKVKQNFINHYHDLISKVTLAQTKDDVNAIVW